MKTADVIEQHPALADPDARGTERKGELARVFNAVAQGVAILAFCPGGVTFAGHHWQVDACHGA